MTCSRHGWTLVCKTGDTSHTAPTAASRHKLLARFLARTSQPAVHTPAALPAHHLRTLRRHHQRTHIIMKCVTKPAGARDSTMQGTPNLVVCQTSECILREGPPPCQIRRALLGSPYPTLHLLCYKVPCFYHPKHVCSSCWVPSNALFWPHSAAGTDARACDLTPAHRL